MKFICGLRVGRSGARSPCQEWFESLAELLEHIDLDHRCTVKINDWIEGYGGAARTQDE